MACDNTKVVPLEEEPEDIEKNQEKKDKKMSSTLVMRKTPEFRLNKKYGCSKTP